MEQLTALREEAKSLKIRSWQSYRRTDRLHAAIKAFRAANAGASSVVTVDGRIVLSAVDGKTAVSLE